MATISDVLEYLYKEGKKDLAKAVIDELKSNSNNTTTILPRPTSTSPYPYSTPWYGDTYH